MTRKHFIAMARMIREAQATATNPKEPDPYVIGMLDLALAIGEMFPNFDKDHFLAACEPK